HFARPGNRFWPALHRSGFTARQLSPFEEHELLALGCGVTNLVAGATAMADELTADQLRAGARALKRKLARWRPCWVAVLGLTSYRIAFEQPKAPLGEQPERIGRTRVWLLPNPSGLNAHHQVADLARMLRTLRKRSREEETGDKEQGRGVRDEG